MKNKIYFAIVVFLVVVFKVWAANPSFQSFDQNYFTTNSIVVGANTNTLATRAYVNSVSNTLGGAFVRIANNGNDFASLPNTRSNLAVHVMTGGDVYTDQQANKAGFAHQLGLSDNGSGGGDYLLEAFNTSLGGFTNSLTIPNLRQIGDGHYGSWRGGVSVIVNGGTNNWGLTTGDGFLSVENWATLQSGSAIAVQMMITNGNGVPQKLSTAAISMVAVSTNDLLGANTSAGFVGLIADPGYPNGWFQVRNVGGNLGNYALFDWDSSAHLLYFPYYQAGKYNHQVSGFQGGVIYDPTIPSMTFSNAAFYFENNTLSNIRLGVGSSGGGGMQPFVMESAQFIDLSKGSPNRQAVATNAIFYSHNANSGALTVEMGGGIGSGFNMHQDSRGISAVLRGVDYGGFNDSNASTNAANWYFLTNAIFYGSSNRIVGSLTTATPLAIDTPANPTAKIFSIMTNGVEKAFFGTNGGLNIGGTVDPGPGGIRFSNNIVGTTTGVGFVGDGSLLTNLNAGELRSGTVPAARLAAGTAGATNFLRGDSVYTNRLDGDFNLNGHLLSVGTAPSIAAGAGAGTGPTIAIVGTDTAGTITCTTGSSPGVGGVIATVTFASAYAATPIVVITGTNSVSAFGTKPVFVTANASTFQLTAQAATTLAATTAYAWNYIVVKSP